MVCKHGVPDHFRCHQCIQDENRRPVLRYKKSSLAARIQEYLEISRQAYLPEALAEAIQKSLEAKLQTMEHAQRHTSGKGLEPPHEAIQTIQKPKKKRTKKLLEVAPVRVVQLLIGVDGCVEELKINQLTAKEQRDLEISRFNRDLRRRHGL